MESNSKNGHVKKLDLERSRSILWKNSSLAKDFELVSALVEKTIVGDKEHKTACALKIIQHIQEKSWQQKYPTRNFVFCIDFASKIKIIDIMAMLTCQALETIHYLLFKKEECDFSKKFIDVFEKIYKFKPNELVSNVLRIMRNNLAHSIAVDGIEEKLKAKDKESVESFSQKFNFSNKKIALHYLAAEFNYLMENITMVILGLDSNDFRFNLRPPQRSDYFS